jgi:hypothetical protein
MLNVRCSAFRLTPFGGLPRGEALRGPPPLSSIASAKEDPTPNSYLPSPITCLGVQQKLVTKLVTNW